MKWEFGLGVTAGQASSGITEGTDPTKIGHSEGVYVTGQPYCHQCMLGGCRFKTSRRATSPIPGDEFQLRAGGKTDGELPQQASNSSSLSYTPENSWEGCSTAHSCSVKGTASSLSGHKTASKPWHLKRNHTCSHLIWTTLQKICKGQGMSIAPTQLAPVGSSQMTQAAQRVLTTSFNLL